MLKNSLSFWSNLKKPTNALSISFSIFCLSALLYTPLAFSNPLQFFVEALDPKADAWVFMDEEEYRGPQVTQERNAKQAFPGNGQLVDSQDDQKIKVCQQCDDKWF